MDGSTQDLLIPELRALNGSTLLSISKCTGIGWYNYIGYRIPSFRKDVIKLAVCGISESYCDVEYVEEKDRELVSQDGKVKYSIKAIPEGDRQERAMAILERYMEELEEL